MSSRAPGAAPAQDTPARLSTRGQILCVAKRLFAERGFGGVSIGEIAAETRVSKANVFHHFHSKDELYLAVMRHITENGDDLLDMDVEDRNASDILTDFAVRRQVRIAEDEENVRLVISEVMSSSPQRGRYIAEELFARDFARFADLIRQMQDRGEVRRGIDPALAASVISAANIFLVQGRSVLPHLPGVTFVDKPEDYARQFMDLLLNGLLVREEAPEPHKEEQ